MSKIHTLMRLAGVLLLTALLMTGCAAIGSGPAINLPPAAPSRVVLSDIPFHAQQKYHCGPAALAMALQWSGVDTTPDQIADMVFTPGRKGSFQSDLITATRRLGRVAYPINGLDCLIQEIAAGTPVVVLQNLGIKWIPKWHYATVIGFDLDQSVVILHTGDKAARRVGFKTFMATWKRSDQWGVLVLPGARMPRCADEATYLKSVHGLHIAGFPEDAIVAYQNAVAAWPDSAQASMALGNALYGKGAVKEAIEAYERAVRNEPRNGDALNNLAHLLAESGDLKAAFTVAHRAVGAGGPRLPIYRKTLEEIRQKIQ